MPGVALVVLIKNYLNSKLHGASKTLGNYRTQKLEDESNNNLFWGYFAFDGWHQNHHKMPNSWYLGRKWWEIDVPGIIIALLSVMSFSFQNFKK
jgi:fatty-acid desaturase